MRRLAFFTAPLLLAMPAGAQGIEDAIDGNPIPDLFAALLGLTLSDEVSGSSLVIDNGGPQADDTELSTFKLPWSDELDVGSAHGTLHLSAVAGLLLAEDRLRIGTPSGQATVAEDWTVAGAQIGAGWTVSVGRGWWVRPSAEIGLAYLDNAASFDEVGRVELEPVIGGILVDWDAWAAIGTLTLSAGRDRDPERLSAGLRARASLSGTDVLDSSSEIWEGTDTSRFGGVRGELGGPTGWLVRGEPLGWDVFASWIHLSGIDEDVGVFEDLFELGAGTSLRLSDRIPPVRIGASVITGPEVRGWSLGLSLGS